MTEKHNGYVVVLENNIRADDAYYIINAMKMIKGVLTVAPCVAGEDANALIEAVRARMEVERRVLDALRPQQSPA